MVILLLVLYQQCNLSNLTLFISLRVQMENSKMDNKELVSNVLEINPIILIFWTITFMFQIKTNMLEFDFMLY
jgi:hypothetical protein